MNPAARLASPLKRQPDKQAIQITFDAQPLIDSQKTGVGYYEAGIVHALLSLYPAHAYSLTYFSFKHKEQKEASLRPYQQQGVRLLDCPWFPGSLYRMLWNFLPVPYRWFFGKQAEITHFFNYHIPPGVPGKKIVTVHDMSYKRFPDTIRFKTMAMLRLSLRRSCQRADHIVTISEFSKQEIIALLGIAPQKISVVPCGVDTAVFSPVKDQTRIAAVKEKYRVPGDYLLYLGTLEPRKNIERLITAYASVKKKDPHAPVLVLAGRKGWLYDDIFKCVTALDMGRDIIFTDYVQEKDIPVLLSGALAFLFPSLYEGFGMPPLEAMACGTPVLTSNVSSLPEVVGDAAVLVDPCAVEDIATGIRSLIDNESLRKTLSEKGLARARLYHWEQAATLMMRVYETVYAHR